MSEHRNGQRSRSRAQGVRPFGIKSIAHTQLIASFTGTAYSLLRIARRTQAQTGHMRKHAP